MRVRESAKRFGRFPLAVAAFCLVSPVGGASQADVDPAQVVRIDVGNIDPIEVGILAPSGRFLVLMDSETQCEGVSATGGRVVITPAIAAGMYWDAEGKEQVVAAFSEVGTFTIHVSDNLETEPDGAFATKQRYVNQHPSHMVVSAGACQKRKS
ncbi:hypothetical protein NB699_002942 [Xanthomonas sacchari]|nr:hypothetical protein [Xanthomonas sacchari]MCW0442117.1 hypothetical protein [Xanthomonas sacchari]MCW0447391.1 hypothetical protein [Xanthomonas sacchari]